MDADRDNERRAAKVWNYLRETHAPIPVKIAFQKFALALLDDVEIRNLKMWQPQWPDDDYDER